MGSEAPEEQGCFPRQRMQRRWQRKRSGLWAGSTMTEQALTRPGKLHRHFGSFLICICMGGRRYAGTFSTFSSLPLGLTPPFFAVHPTIKTGASLLSFRQVRTSQASLAGKSPVLECVEFGLAHFRGSRFGGAPLGPSGWGGVATASGYPAGCAFSFRARSDGIDPG